MTKKDKATGFAALRAWVEEQAENREIDVALFAELDAALIGLAERGHGQDACAVYDYNRCVKIFMAQGMDRQEALEWLEQNVVGTGLALFLETPDG